MTALIPHHLCYIMLGLERCVVVIDYVVYYVDFCVMWRRVALFMFIPTPLSCFTQNPRADANS